MKNIHGGDQILAAAAYIPLVGWIYPYTSRKDDELCQFHGRQAMILNIMMVALYFAIWLLENFPVTALLFGQGAWFAPITGAISLIATLVYIGLSLTGAFKAISEEKWPVPYLEDLVERFEDQVRGDKK